MPIHTVIRNKRKELGLTQEQVANYLGVSAPAVNKWEKGTTCPDVSILPPLARILKTDLNTLLCFEESMTTAEITQFSSLIIEDITKNGYESGFLLADEKIKKYPNCAELIDTCATLLEGALFMYGSKVENKDFYEKQILSLYERAAEGDNEQVRNKALYMLASKYIGKKDHEKAQQMLDRLPERSALDKKHLQAKLYREQHKLAESAALLERKLLSEINEVQMTIFSLIEVELDNGNDSKAEKLADGLCAIVKQFELWDYNAYVAPLQIAIRKKNVSKTIASLRSMLEQLMTPWTLQNSTLYDHIKKKEPSSQDPQKEASSKPQEPMGKSLLPAILSELEHNPDYEFLRSNTEFTDLIKEYQKKMQ